MVAGKQVCSSKATLRGPSGHGWKPLRGGAMGSLGKLRERLGRKRLPVHVPAVTRSMVEAIAAELPAALAAPLRGLLRPALSDRVLAVLGERGRGFDPLLHNTVSATIVTGGGKSNGIPHQGTGEPD